MNPVLLVGLVQDVERLERDAAELLKMPEKEARERLREWYDRHADLWNRADLPPRLNERLRTIEAILTNHFRARP